MNNIQRTIRNIIALSIFSLTAFSASAKTIDVSKSVKDIKVMTRIFEASLESSSESFPGRINIDGTYLAKQGYLFDIRLNGMSSFGIPGVASWDRGRLELDIPEIIESALSSIDYGEDMDSDVNDDVADAVAPIIDSLDGIYKSEELQDQLSELREKQRNVRRETYQLRRDIRSAEDQVKREQLEVQLEKSRLDIKKYSEDYSQALNTYKKGRTARQVKKSMDAIDAVFTTVCEYGQSLRALKNHEKFTLIISGGVAEDGIKSTQVFVLEKGQIKNCTESKKLRENAIYYTI